MRAIRSFLIAVLLLNSFGNSQTPVGAIFLLISPSPAMNGMGQLGAALPSQDIFSIYYNPANFPRTNGLSLAYSFESRTSWLSNLASDMFFHYEAGLAGYQFARQRLAFSLGYYRTYLDLGTQIRTDENGKVLGTFSSWMSADVVTFGARTGFNLGIVPLSVSVGGALKNVVQDLVNRSDYKAQSDDRFYDFGFILTAPFSAKSSFLDFGLSVEPALGYSILNMGDEVRFIDESQADPPPTLGRLGFSISCSVTGLKSRYPIVALRYGREVDDILVVMEKKDGDWDWYIDAPLGDIEVAKHLIQDKPSAGITLHRGQEITAFDFYSIRRGEYIDLEGNLKFLTDGISIHGKPILRLIDHVLGLTAPNTISHYIDFRYNESREVRSIRDDTQYANLTLTFQHLDDFVSKLWPK